MSPSPSRREAIALGRIVAAFIRAGWNPPKPSSRVVARITEDMEAATAWEAGPRWHFPTLELTALQMTVLQLLADGKTQPQIARELRRSPETVKESSKMLREKLGARNTTHAVAIAMRRGLLT